MSESEKDPMTAAAPKFDPSQSSPERAADQVGNEAWPKPGDEGYVHPDGTPQAAGQLADNKRAAADRAAAGSIIHGAPAVQRGGRPDATDIANERAQAYSGPSTADRDEQLTATVREGQDQAAEHAADVAAADAGQPASAQRAGGRANTDQSAPKSER